MANIKFEIDGKVYDFAPESFVIDNEGNIILKLKPCKFCGGLGKIRTVPFDSEDYELFRKYSDIEHDDCSFVVECSHCGATIDPIYTLENAVKVWNSGEARLVNDKP